MLELLDGEVEVEVPSVLDGDVLDLLLVDVDIMEIHTLDLVRVQGAKAMVVVDVVVEDVPDPFNIERDGPALPLDVTDQVVIEGLLDLGGEYDLYIDIGVGVDDSAHWVDNQRIRVLNVPSDAFLKEAERDGDVLEVP